jgi:hypothetical protein
MRGINKAKQVHEDNTGLPYKALQIKDNGGTAEVRILQPQDEWVSLFFHQKYQVLKRTRCASEDSAKSDDCPLCVAGAPRQLKTFIPVRVRGDAEQERVQIVEAGNETLNEIIFQIEDLPEDTDVTYFDFKIKRVGVGLDTKYKCATKNGTKRPLDKDEQALTIPDIETLVPVPDELKLIQRTKEFTQASSVTPTEEGEKEGSKSSGSKSRF